MTRSVRAILIVLTMLTMALAIPPAAAVAQDAAPAKPQEKAEERPTGLPSRMTWTFNFDAGWGTFGFANSLYDNPKEPGVEENLSDQWFEGYVKPALSGELHVRVVERGLRQGERRRRAHVRIGAGSLSVRTCRRLDLKTSTIGWRSGESLTMGENALDFIIGRAQYRLGHGFLLLDGAAEGGSRGGYWTNARKAFEFAAIGRLKPGSHTIEALLSRQGRTERERQRQPALGNQLRGLSAGESTTVGATYMKWFANAAIAPERDGLNVFNLRAYTAPIPKAPDLSFEFEYASERNGEALNSNAWTLHGRL